MNCADRTHLNFSFRSVDEARAGDKWRREFDARWPAYKDWFLRSDEAKRPTYLDSVTALSPRNLPGAEGIALDVRVLLFTLGGIFFAGLLSGMVPAWSLARSQPAAALSESSQRGGVGRGTQALRVILAGGQVGH